MRRGFTLIVICPSSKRTMGYSQYIGQGYTSTTTGGTSQGVIKRPSQTVLCGDSYNQCMLPSSWRRPAGSPIGSAYGSVTAACGWRTPCAPHNDGANFAFVDGHVKWLKGDASIYLPGTAAAPETPTPDFRGYEGGNYDIWLIGDK